MKHSSTKFIDKIVDLIKEKHLDQLRKRCYIFPTKRGELYFRKALIAKFPNKTFWSSQVYSIQEFVEYVCGKKVTNPTTLLFELYEVYKKIDTENTLDSFEKFYPWGEVLLKDYDEIDKYLVDATNLYQTIYDIKELEAFFGNDDEAIEALRNFRTVLSEKDKTELLRKFLKIWQVTGDVYQAFKLHLTEKKLAYEGMLYRELVHLFETKEDKLIDQFDNIYFCGFNALSNAEEKILDILFKQERGVAFWDADPIYMENPWHEANMFLKKYEQNWETIRSYWFREYMLSSPKKIKIIGTVQNVLQTKIVAQLITDEVEKTQAVLNNTVLVLADENLLMPTLYSLPEDIKSANVTMGYPAVQSPLYNLIDLLFDLQITRRGVGKNAQYNSSQILKFFKNSYIHTLSEENYPDYIYWLSINRRTFLKLENIENIVKEDKIKMAFTSQKTSKDFLTFLIAFLKEVFDYFYDDEQSDDKEDDSQKSKYQQEKDFIYHFIINIQQLEKRLDDNLHKISITLLKKLTLDYLRLVKIPFTGDIESGIQIMGFLETRTLDFENVFILSVNEGQLPSERKLNSFIPYSVRKAFKMPTFEEQDAIYCYHFYRLLQRAKNVYLIYDTEVKSGGGSGEKSRFISQLMRIIKKDETTKIQISEEIISINPPKNLDGVKGIEIEKTNKVLAELDKFLVDPKDADKVVKYFSPTALSHYLECPLRFYFSYVAELKSADVNSERIEAVDLGNVVHECLENIYKPYTQKIIQPEEYKKLTQDAFITEHIEAILIKYFFISENHEELVGRNIVLFNIIFQIIKSVLQKDSEQAPFSIFSVEYKARRQQLHLDTEKIILLSGVVDRVDKLNPESENTLRVVDYKTGYVKINENRRNQPDPEYIEKYFSNSQLKSGLQAYFYTYLFKQQNALQTTKAGIYSLKEVNRGVQMLRKGEIISDELLDLYEQNLKHHLGEIFDTKVPFTQTEDHKKCIYCDFREVCSR